LWWCDNNSLRLITNAICIEGIIFSMQSGQPPLVSVIIRTLGRASLAASVESVVRQSHRPIELVIVNASGKPLPALPATPSVDLQRAGAGELNRPEAANAGLASATGEWLIFLDDDDTFFPDHIESLLATLDEAPDALVAYSATACLDCEGRSVATLSCDFDRLVLMKRNYIQIGAALFSSRLVAEGYRFDENFECFQDWDFWIQLAQRTRFAFTGRATNRWSADSGKSGCGMGANSDRARQDRFGGQLMRKWSVLSAQLQRKVRHHNELGERALRKSLIEEAHRHFAAAEAVMRGVPLRVRTPKGARALRVGSIASC
jgi:glycosyltransferase involved in cell wall biosynthesis